jgi:hypothetical protein
MKYVRPTVAVCLAVTAVASATGGFPIGVRAASKNAPVPAAATIENHGLKITLSAPRGTYPRNALVATSITVKNVSSKSIPILRWACLPSIRTLVLGKKGHPYPPPVNLHPPSCGPSRPSKPLVPGGVLRTTSLVVLRSGSLRADLRIAGGQSGSLAVSGNVLRLTLVPGAAEHVRLTSGTPGHPNAGFTASIRPVQKRAGRLYVASWQSCRQANGTGQDTGTFPGQWLAASRSILRTSILRPSCGHQMWQFAAGWIGHPVAKLDLNVSAS